MPAPASGLPCRRPLAGISSIYTRAVHDGGQAEMRCGEGGRRPVGSTEYLWEVQSTCGPSADASVSRPSTMLESSCMRRIAKCPAISINSASRRRPRDKGNTYFVLVSPQVVPLFPLARLPGPTPSTSSSAISRLPWQLLPHASAPSSPNQASGFLSRLTKSHSPFGLLAESLTME